MDVETRCGLHVCVDRVLPKDLERRRRMLTEPPAVIRGGREEPPSRLAIIGVKRWDNGRTLSVAFTDGDPAVQSRVRDHAMGWGDHANIGFEFGGGDGADIRISFLHPGSWSYIGVDAKGIDTGEATMNFGWLQPETADDEYERVVLHEFGHALGAIHEHQSPATKIPWDREAVYEYYMGPPNNWTKEQVDINLFTLYDETITQFSSFDEESIMLYPVPNELTLGDYEVGWNNRTLSETDRRWIRRTYPGAPPAATRLVVNGEAATAAIGAHGEGDRYTFTAPEAGSYVVETGGDTDVVMQLAGPDNAETVIAEDDDSGERYNARIATALEPGTYHVRVWHFPPIGTGKYTIGVRMD